MNSTENRKPISGRQADACTGRRECSGESEQPNAPIDYEQRLKAASAILARVALRIAGGTTDGSAGNPSVLQTAGGIEDSLGTAPSTAVPTATVGASANPSTMPEGPAGETPPPSLSGLPGGRQDSADPTIDEAEGGMEVRAA